MAQNLLQPHLGKARRLRIDLRIHHMRGHHRSHTLGRELAKRHDIGRFQLGQAAIVLRQHMVAVAFHEAVAGKMLAAGFHAAFV